MYFDLHLFVGIFEHINLGVLETNPISISGAMKVGKWLGQHVLKGPTGHDWPILCNGDQLSVERIIQAHVGFSTNKDGDERRLGLVPTPQEPGGTTHI